jgi:catechol-2,3-dioxygenase
MNTGIKTSYDQTQAPVSLSARDVDGLKQFYIDTLGFSVGSDNSNILYLESKPVLRFESSANPKKKVSLGINLPNRRELAKVIGRLCTMKYSNTRKDVADRQLTMLVDPEGNQVEFFVLKKASDNTSEKPLDIEALFNELLPDDRLCDKLPASAEITIEEV